MMDGDTTEPSFAAGRTSLQGSRPREYSQSTKSGLESGVYWAWIVLLLWAPVPLGSVDAWALALLQASVLGLLAVMAIGCALSWITIPESLRAARWWLALMVLWLVFGAMYWVPMPIDWIAVLSPKAAALHGETLAIDNGWRTLAVDAFAAKAQWLKSATCVAAAVLTLWLVNSRERVRQFMLVLVSAAFVFALFGIMMHLVGARTTWFGSLIQHAEVARGTYFNRNHFAGYLEMMLALGVGLLIADTRDRKADSWRKLLRHFLEWLFSGKFRLRLMLCVLVIALVCTRSRMGNTAFFASLLVAGVMGLLLSRHAPRGTIVLLGSLIAIDLFIVGSWFGVEKLAQRLEQTAVVRPAVAATGGEESLESRLDASVDTLPMIQDHLLLGVGGGGWAGRFLNYRGPDLIEGIFEHAHNDYAEFLAEYGVIGFALLMIMAVWALAAALRAQWVRRDPMMRGVSFASLMGVLSILIHSWVDFNLQIPANALYFMVLLALGFVSLYSNRRDGGRRRHDPPRGSAS